MVVSRNFCQKHPLFYDTPTSNSLIFAEGCLVFVSCWLVYTSLVISYTLDCRSSAWSLPKTLSKVRGVSREWRAIRCSIWCRHNAALSTALERNRFSTQLQHFWNPGVELINCMARLRDRPYATQRQFASQVLDRDRVLLPLNLYRPNGSSV